MDTHVMNIWLTPEGEYKFLQPGAEPREQMTYLGEAHVNVSRHANIKAEDLLGGRG